MNCIFGHWKWELWSGMEIMESVTVIIDATVKCVIILYQLTSTYLPVQGRGGIRLALFRRSSTVAKTTNAGSMNSDISVRGCCDSSDARVVQL